MKKGLVFTGMGFELVGLVLGSLYLGGIIDRHMEWQGYGVAAILIIGFIGWIIHLILLLKRFMADSSGE